MSAMEDMLVSVLRKVLPPNVIEMLSAENIQRVTDTIKSEYKMRTDQLDRIELMLRTLQPAPSWGERIAAGEGIFIDTDQPEPLQILIARDIQNDGSNGFNGHAVNGS